MAKCAKCGHLLEGTPGAVCRGCGGQSGVGEAGGGKPPVVEYWPVSLRPRTGAKILWISMIVVAVVAFAAFFILLFNPSFGISEYLGGGIAGTPFSPLTIVNGTGPSISAEEERKVYWMRASVYVFLFLFTQWLFLTPRGSWRIKVSTTGPLPRRAALAAGFLGMLLAMGFIAALLEIPDWWISLTTETGLNSRQHFGVVWILMGLLWVFWTFVFYHYFRGMERYSAMARLFRWLIAGTVLELLIAGPAHALIVYYRGDDCYCERGTWTGVAFGCTAAFWLFGPGAALLMMREIRRRQQLI